MIYPQNFEQKIGFDEIRTLLTGHCLSTLGIEQMCIRDRHRTIASFNDKPYVSDRRVSNKAKER